MEASDAEVKWANGGNGTISVADEALPQPPPVREDVVPISVQGDSAPVEKKTARVIHHMDPAASRTARESLDLAFRMSNILDTGLDRHTLSVLIALSDLGLNPEALAAVVIELQKEPSSSGGMAPSEVIMEASDAEVNGANGGNGTLEIYGMKEVIMETSDAEVNGANGVNRANGVNGTNGANGGNWTDGVNGTNGTNGANGMHELIMEASNAVVNGANSVNRANGVNGTNGTNGANGGNWTISVADEALPQPPPVHEDIVPISVQGDSAPVEKKTARVPIARSGLALRGEKVQLITNHTKVNVTNVDGHFFHYSVALFYEDGCPVDGKGVGRKVLDRVYETYKDLLGGKDFAYDGEKSLFTAGALPHKKLEFTVVLKDISSNRSNVTGSHADGKRLRRPYQSKTYKVKISYAAKIPVQAIAQALRGQESENSQEALRVLDIILRQHAAKQDCLLLRQSFFRNDVSNFTYVGGGVLGCRGFHSSFRTTQGGLSLNIDVSTTMIIQPGPVVDFLIANQNVKDPFSLDWAKAERVLKNLRVKTTITNTEYKITGLSEQICKELFFSMKQKGEKDENGEQQMTELTVYDYFVNFRKIPLWFSGDLPCINVGKPKRPTYIPLEFCSLVSMQRYTKALTTLQRASLMEKSRQKPQHRRETLKNALRINNYADEPLLRTSGVSVSSNFTTVEGRILSAPKLKVGNGEDFVPLNGRWNFKDKEFVEPTTVEWWAVVNFSACRDSQNLVHELMKCGVSKGITCVKPLHVFDEDPQHKRAPPHVRVEKMFELIQNSFSKDPRFLLCLLPERKSLLYGPWKRKILVGCGIVTQCIAPIKVNDQYLTNVLLKINAKLGGLNSKLSMEAFASIPLISKVPTIILGMNVSHGSPEQSDVPSVAAVVSSRAWPLISKYKASVRTQCPKAEMIDSLFKKVGDKDDAGIMREVLMDFYESSGKRFPDQIIIFRDGVSQSQFNQVLNVELNQIIEACKLLDENYCPKFVVIIAQKNHHTRFFQTASPENVPPGTVIDNGICHPRNNDFYLCAQAGMIGTTRPTHYHVLLDEVGFSPDDLQEFVHSLSYVYQRSTTAISVVAPLRYARLAATQMRQFMKFDDMSETPSRRGGGVTPVPKLPRLQKNVRDSMFFV